MTESKVTLGIDLGVPDENTAVCAIRWEAGSGVITRLNSSWSNDGLRDLIAEADWTGIDTPFSWPVRFRETLAEHGVHGGWPADYRSLDYQLRSTDLFVKKIARRPLSVSTDLLGVTAMRCARLLQEVGTQRGDRLSLTGEDKIVEIYPAASLTAWGGATAGFNPTGYKKGPTAKQARAQLVLSLVKTTDPWLDFTPECQQSCIASDNVLDALIAALTTRAAQLGMTWEPETDHPRKLPAIEGWIHVPKSGTIELLGGSTISYRRRCWARRHEGTTPAWLCGRQRVRRPRLSDWGGVDGRRSRRTGIRMTGCSRCRESTTSPRPSRRTLCRSTLCSGMTQSSCLTQYARTKSRARTKAGRDHSSG